MRAQQLTHLNISQPERTISRTKNIAFVSQHWPLFSDLSGLGYKFWKGIWTCSHCPIYTCQGLRISGWDWVLVNRMTYSTWQDQNIKIWIPTPSLSATMISKCKGREENKFLSSWSTAYASLSLRPASSEAQGKEGSPSPGHAPCSTIIIIREVQGAGQLWLDGQMGQATLWWCVDLSKLERKEISQHYKQKNGEIKWCSCLSPLTSRLGHQPSFSGEKLLPHIAQDFPHLA